MEKFLQIFVNDEVEVVDGGKIFGRAIGSDNAEKNSGKIFKAAESAVKISWPLMPMFQLKMFINRSFNRIN